MSTSSEPSTAPPAKEWVGGKFKQFSMKEVFANIYGLNKLINDCTDRDEKKQLLDEKNILLKILLQQAVSSQQMKIFHCGGSMSLHQSHLLSLGQLTWSM